MNYNNIIIIKDNLIYFKNQKKEVILCFNKEVLKNSKIINLDKFIKDYYKQLKDNNISSFFWNKKIAIIYDSIISQNDLKVIKNVFTELNYKMVDLFSDNSLLKLNKKDNYLITGNIYKLYYIDDYNIKRVLLLDKEILNTQEMHNLIKRRTNNKNVFIVGNNFQEDLVKDLNYYVFDSYLEFFCNLLNEVK